MHPQRTKGNGKSIPEVLGKQQEIQVCDKLQILMSGFCSFPTFRSVDNPKLQFVLLDQKSTEQV